MSQSLRKHIALNVKYYREQKGYNRDELTLLLGVAKKYISKLEKARVNITIDKLEQISLILEIDVLKLLQQ